MSKRSPKLGATGQHPEGKMNMHDEGALQFGVSNDGSHVILNFGTPVAWLGMGPGDARELAKTLIRHADAVDAGAY